MRVWQTSQHQHHRTPRFQRGRVSLVPSVCQGVVLIAILFLKSIIDLTFDKFLGIIL